MHNIQETSYDRHLIGTFSLFWLSQLDSFRLISPDLGHAKSRPSRQHLMITVLLFKFLLSHSPAFFVT